MRARIISRLQHPVTHLDLHLLHAALNEGQDYIPATTNGTVDAVLDAGERSMRARIISRLQPGAVIGQSAGGQDRSMRARIISRLQLAFDFLTEFLPVSAQ